MKILHIVHYDSYPRTNETFIGRAQNGLERWLDSMILNSDKDHEHYVLYFNFYDKSIAVQRILKNGLPAEYTNFFAVDYTEEELLPIFAKILAWFSPGLVHIHYLQPYTKVIPNILHACKFDNIIATMHDESFLGDNFGMNQQYVYDAQVADFFTHIKKVVFLHDVSMERYMKLYRNVLPLEKVIKIANGVTLEKVATTNEQDRPFTILFLGSFIENKGSKIIAEFANLMQEKEMNVQLYLLGRSLDDSLATTNIVYMGPYTQNNITEKVQMINPDVVVIASIVEETFSYTSFEASALGYPVVAFNVGALGAVEQEGRGFVVEDKTARALAEKLQELMALKGNNFGAWTEKVKTIKQFTVFSVEDMVQAYEKLYDEIGRKEEAPIDTQSLFQQNLMNLKQKEQHFFDAMEAYRGTMKELKAAREMNKEENMRAETRESKGTILHRGMRYMRKHGGFFNTLSELHSLAKLYGWKNVYHKVVHLNADLDYLQWRRANEFPYTALQVDDLLNNLTYQPKISVLMPVYNVGEVYLRACIDSIRAQSYTNWELCIADDASPAPHIKTVLKEYMQQDVRIKVVFRSENGHISEATNSALELATGEFVAFIDNDDLIVQDAFLEVIKLLNEHPDADFIYSDEDKINADGTKRIDPFFKPDWSPDSLWSHMYVTHLTVFRTRIAREIGGLRVGLEGSQDYDFVLRFVEKTEKIYHIPKVLYHWRMLETSAASGADVKDYAFDAAIRAKEDAIVRRKLNAKIEALPQYVASNIVFSPRETDFVSIIIVGTSVAQITQSVQSIYDKTTSQAFEIMIISDNKKLIDDVSSLIASYSNLRVVPMNEPFHYAKWNNAAAAQARGNILFFLHEAIEIITTDWLERMVGQAIQPQTGVVGAKLLTKDQVIQESGIVFQDNKPMYAFDHLPYNDLGYFGRAVLNYNYLAVSEAALMIEKSMFESIGGFDEAFDAVYSAIELCLKVYRAGCYNIVRNDVMLYHLVTNEYNSLSNNERSPVQIEHAQNLLHKKFADIMHDDPFFNCHLTSKGAYFVINK